MKRAFFWGIGGIGMSALALWYLEEGWEVWGEDLKNSFMVKEVVQRGARVFVGKGSFSLSKFDRVIYSLAIPKKEVLKRAQRVKEVWSYPQALGEKTHRFFTFCVAGSHGKSTTTALLSLVLERAGFSPYVVVGTRLKEFGHLNFKKGSSPFLVVEADEYRGAFWNYLPQVVLLTNIDKEHLDFYKTFSGVKRGFAKFLERVPETGFIITHPSKEIQEVLKMGKVKARVIFTQKQNKSFLKKYMYLPGLHNIDNANLVLSFSRMWGIEDSIVLKVIQNYKGAWRRFEVFRVTFGGKKIVVVSDYAHHPTELLALAHALKERWPHREHLVFFQPHQRERTYFLQKEWIGVFRKIAELGFTLYILPIFEVAGRESYGRKITSKELVRDTREENVRWIAKENVLGFLEKSVRGKEIVSFVGAGDIVNLTEKILK